MKKTVVIKQLSLLAKLQDLDNKIHYIEQLRGNLPDELLILEKEKVKTINQLDEIRAIIQKETTAIETEKTLIKESQSNLDKYEIQKDKIANNREYEAICKAIESCSLDVLLSEKKIKNSTNTLNSKTPLLDLYNDKLLNLEESIEKKKAELKLIMDEQIVEDNELRKKRSEALISIDIDLLDHYEKIRNGAKNGLAAVNVIRGACGACFMIMPVEKQIEIAAHEAIEKCEYCGAILLDAPLDEIPEKGYIVYNPVAEIISDNT